MPGELHKIRMYKKVIRMLDEAQKILKDENKWCKGSLALDQYGNEVGPATAKAVAWSVHGVMRRIDFPIKNKYLGKVRILALELLHQVAREKHKNIDDLNDFNDHGRIVRVFDEAILLAVEKQKQLIDLKYK